MIIFSKWNIEFVKNMYTFKNSYLFSNNSLTCDALRKILIYFLKIYKNIHSKIHLHVKVIFVKKDLQSFSKVILLAPSYKFWPYSFTDCTFYNVFFLNVDFFNNVILWKIVNQGMHQSYVFSKLMLIYFLIFGVEFLKITIIWSFTSIATSLHWLFL